MPKNKFEQRSKRRLRSDEQLNAGRYLKPRSACTSQSSLLILSAVTSAWASITNELIMSFMEASQSPQSTHTNSSPISPFDFVKVASPFALHASEPENAGQSQDDARAEDAACPAPTRSDIAKVPTEASSTPKTSDASRKPVEPVATPSLSPPVNKTATVKDDVKRTAKHEPTPVSSASSKGKARETVPEKQEVPQNKPLASSATTASSAATACTSIPVPTAADRAAVVSLATKHAQTAFEAGRRAGAMFAQRNRNMEPRVKMALAKMLCENAAVGSSIAMQQILQTYPKPPKTKDGNDTSAGTAGAQQGADSQKPATPLMTPEEVTMNAASMLVEQMQRSVDQTAQIFCELESKSRAAPGKRPVRSAPKSAPLVEQAQDAPATSSPNPAKEQRNRKRQALKARKKAAAAAASAEKKLGVEPEQTKNASGSKALRAKSEQPATEPVTEPPPRNSAALTEQKYIHRHVRCPHGRIRRIKMLVEE